LDNIHWLLKVNHLRVKQTTCHWMAVAGLMVQLNLLARYVKYISLVMAS